LLFAGCSAVFYLYTLSVFGNFSAWNFAVMCGNVLLYILMLISITILASTIVKNSIAAGGIGFVCYILFGTIFDFFEPLKKYSPNTIFATYRDIVEKGWDSDLLWPIIVMITVIILSVLLSIAIFRRQEIER
jgi:ABC-2 type transport system permease protein